MALSRAAIVDAGLGILDAYGLGDLSMRRVADALGVQAGALYYHVPNKQSLLAALSDEVLAEVPEPDQGLAAGEWLAVWADGVRAALLARRDGAELVASSLALGLGGVDLAPPARRLADAGNPRPDAT
ncbi:MAG TPA: TetR family transcriptional regulator, partial [Arachnia sp.]|nr:TetR family transcriptional regulator [Arachnia sp.]